MSILHHDGEYYTIFSWKLQDPFVSSDNFYSAVWMVFVRQFGDHLSASIDARVKSKTAEGDSAVCVWQGLAEWARACWEVGDYFSALETSTLVK